MKKVALKNEPSFKGNNWAVKIITGRSTQYRYAMNLKEVEEIKAGAPKGARIHVFKQVSSFREAFQK